MIPKVIHYIWLGKKPKPNMVNICKNSWRKYLPEFQIMEWNEDNLDIDQMAKENRFFSECRKRNMWAYMADYIRLKILYELGGVYMDTDVQIHKDITPLLDVKGFISLEAGDYIGTGLIGVEPGMDIIKNVLEFYEHKIWEVDFYTIPKIFTYIMQNDQCKNEITIFPKEYFSPCGYNEIFDYSMITENTYAIHWFYGGWGKRINEKVFLETKHIKNPLYKGFKALRITARIAKGRIIA